MRHFPRLLVMMAVGALAAHAQETTAQEEEPPNRFTTLRENVRTLMNSVQGLSDWDTHYGLMMNSFEKVFERNGWTSEPDQFSLNLIREVNSIPPWSPQERFDKFMEVVSDRYLLDEDQENTLKRIVIREAFGIYLEHSDRIVAYATDAISTRAAGEAFTPEKVAKWIELARPVMETGRARMNVAAKELQRQLDPEQKALLQADLDAANHRMSDMERMSASWAKGEWTPTDWGMEEDPIQLAGEARNAAAGDSAKQQPGGDVAKAMAESDAAAAGEGRKRVDLSRVVPPGMPRPNLGGTPTAPVNADDPWAQYVRQFIARYKLNEAQQSSAWRIYKAVQTRGDRYRALYDEQIESARRRAANSEAASADGAVKQLEGKRAEALERLFEQMKRRLERLPTRAQREAAKAAEPAPAADGSAQPIGQSPAGP